MPQTFKKTLGGSAPTPYSFPPDGDDTRRKDRLQELQRRLRESGARGIHFFWGAASDADGAVVFGMQNVTRKGQVDWSASGHPLFHRRFALSNKLYVRSFDLGRILRRIDFHLRGGGGGDGGGGRRGQIVMKLDAEGFEYRMLMHLILTQTMCLVDTLDVEWHDKFLRQAVKANRTTRAAADGSTALRPDTTGASAIAALTSPNGIAGLPLLFRNALNNGKPRADCRTRLIAKYDESYLQDGMPWPTRSLCAS